MTTSTTDLRPDRPALSCVIPAYNEAAWLPRLLDSVDAALWEGGE